MEKKKTLDVCIYSNILSIESKRAFKTENKIHSSLKHLHSRSPPILMISFIHISRVIITEADRPDICILYSCEIFITKFSNSTILSLSTNGKNRLPLKINFKILNLFVI